MAPTQNVGGCKGARKKKSSDEWGRVSEVYPILVQGMLSGPVGWYLTGIEMDSRPADFLLGNRAKLLHLPCASVLLCKMVAICPPSSQCGEDEIHSRLGRETQGKP